MEAVNSIQYLESRLDSVKSEQGIIGKFWNKVKETTKLGVSETKCQSTLEDYKNGLISFDEAIEYIEKYEKKQEDMAGLLSNVATGIGSIAITIAAIGGGPISWAAALTYGAPAGAAIKSALNFTDRATNEIEGDALDAKEITRDVISGAATGATSAVSSHILAGVEKTNLGLSVLNGLKYGAECGAVAGSVNYTANALLDEDKEFKFGDLTKHTLASTAISGSVGAIVGSSVYGFENIIKNTGEKIAMSLGEQTAFDSTTSSARKFLAQGERNIFMKNSV